MAEKSKNGKGRCWTPVALPTHQLIDDVSPDNPVAVTRTDGHILLANTVAMKLSGIDKSTMNVSGGVNARDTAGKPTGIFKDAAVPLILKMIPQQKQPQITGKRKDHSNEKPRMQAPISLDAHGLNHYNESPLHQGSLARTGLVPVDSIGWSSQYSCLAFPSSLLLRLLPPCS